MRTDLAERKARWEIELQRTIGLGNRWGECRRFAGKSAGIRIARRDWLIEHIAAAEGELRKAVADEELAGR